MHASVARTSDAAAMLQFKVWDCTSGARVLVQASTSYDPIWGFHRFCRYLRLPYDPKPAPRYR